MRTNLSEDEERRLLKRLREAVGQAALYEQWNTEDADYPTVGSYTSYQVFRLLLEHLGTSDGISCLPEEATIEGEAASAFRSRFQQNAMQCKYVAHILDTGDTDTIFVPVTFAEPVEFEEYFVGSLPCAIEVLRAFSEVAKFELLSAPDDEIVDGEWNPIATAFNVARILYAFFHEKPRACVSYE